MATSSCRPGEQWVEVETAAALSLLGSQCSQITEHLIQGERDPVSKNNVESSSVRH